MRCQETNIFVRKIGGLGRKCMWIDRVRTWSELVSDNERWQIRGNSPPPSGSPKAALRAVQTTIRSNYCPTLHRLRPNRPQRS